MPPALAANPSGQFFIRAGTPAVGNEFILQNGTPTIATWTAPPDGLYHSVVVIARVNVTSAETGGAVSVNIALAGVVITNNFALLSAGLGTGITEASLLVLIKGGETVQVVQSSALTAGAATLAVSIDSLN